MFSMAQKRSISDAIQKILRETNHPELPAGEIQFHIHIKGAEEWSWANITNNGTAVNPGVNPFNERQALQKTAFLLLSRPVGVPISEAIAPEEPPWTSQYADLPNTSNKIYEDNWWEKEK